MSFKYSFLVLLALSYSSALNLRKAELKLDNIAGKSISLFTDKPVDAKEYQFVYKGPNGNVLHKTCRINANGQDSWGSVESISGVISSEPNVAQFDGDKIIVATSNNKVSFAYQERGTTRFTSWKALPTTSKDIPGMLANGRPAVGISRIGDVSTVLIATADQSRYIYVYAGTIDRLSNGTPEAFFKLPWDSNRLVQDPMITCYSRAYGERYCVLVYHVDDKCLRMSTWKDGSLRDIPQYTNVDQIVGCTAVDYDHEIEDYTAYIVYMIVGGHLRVAKWDYIGLMFTTNIDVPLSGLSEARDFGGTLFFLEYFNGVATAKTFNSSEVSPFSIAISSPPNVKPYKSLSGLLLGK